MVSDFWTASELKASSYLITILKLEFQGKILVAAYISIFTAEKLLLSEAEDF